MTSNELNLDVCTPEGKTWLSLRTGRGAHDRQFIDPDERDLSRSGMTGTLTYIDLADGVYESNEGRRRLGRRWWIIKDGQITEVDAAAGVRAI